MGMPFPRDYWTAYERVATSLSEYVAVMQQLSRTWPDRRFVWRGIADARYALQSSLYRLATARHGGPPREGGGTGVTLRTIENEIVAEARMWGLQRSAVDRLSALELLAALQHQGVPTRLLDFSHNALVGLWFAVEQKFDANGNPRPDRDGRVFVAQSNVREISPTWERSADLPWAGTPPADWLSDIYIWTPPAIDPRMTRQQGCFVFGGVPTTTGGWNLPGTPARMMRTHEIRQCVSVPIRMNNPRYIDDNVVRGRTPRYPLAFTLRIPVGAKAEIRRDLEVGLGFTHAMMYPDYPGFAAFGRSIRR
jgi:hypothetical protein